MEKFSVKKPFTVLVAVVMILILGFVAVTKMDTNLLPNVNTPYLMVVTVYPGASPERVESEVSDVLQNSLTVPGVSKITATSAENYSLLLMEFTEDTDMNSALVKVSNKLDQAKSDLPSTCLTPSIIAQAAAGLAAKGMPITEASLHAAMGMSHVPDPDLIIRTGGEMRISNFLLWQAAYSELFFSDRLWPDFDEAALDEALDSFQSRERRFGKTSEQIASAHRDPMPG